MIPVVMPLKSIDNFLLLNWWVLRGLKARVDREDFVFGDSIDPTGCGPDIRRSDGAPRR